jgi:hypothetical protein
MYVLFSLLALGSVFQSARIRDMRRRLERLETMLMQRSGESKIP